MTAAVAGPRKASRQPTQGKKIPGKQATAKKAPRRPAAAPPSSADRRRAQTINRRLTKAYPDARCTLDYSSPLELLIATILSAQCTDERVNIVTRDLFRKYPTAAHYASAPLAELEAGVRSTGFFRNKARSIHAAATLLVDQHGGQVPETMDELLALPGVARKTANVVLGNAFGQASGVVVDTHVQRVTRRLGLTAEQDPAKIEREMMALLPPREWVQFSHRVIQHGRRVCLARKPRCAECILADLCPSAEV
jgi:endonuclease-3